RDPVLRLRGSSEDRLEGLRVDGARLRDAHASETRPFWRRVRRIDGLLDPRRQLLGGPHAADVHEEDVRVIEEEVVVQRSHLEPVVEGGAHRRIHLRLGQDDVAHDHRLIARRLERGPGREALERLHLDPVDDHPEVAPGHADLRDAVLHIWREARDLGDQRRIGLFGRRTPHHDHGENQQWYHATRLHDVPPFVLLHYRLSPFCSVRDAYSASYRNDAFSTVSWSSRATNGKPWEIARRPADSGVKPI